MSRAAPRWVLRVYVGYVAVLEALLITLRHTGRPVKDDLDFALFIVPTIGLAAYQWWRQRQGGQNTRPEG